MLRILVIGNCGSGKTTVAGELGRKLRLPVLSLDKHFWKPSWEPTERSEWIPIVRELVSGDQWIIDGNYHSTLEIRLEACDTVVFLDFPTQICLFRVLKRQLMHLGQEGDHSAAGCPERFDFEFLKYVVTYNHKMRPRMLEKVDPFKDRKQIVFLKNPMSVNEFLISVLISIYLLALPNYLWLL